jgi:hypothetical protein
MVSFNYLKKYELSQILSANLVLIDQKKCSENKTLMINVLDDQPKISLRLKRKQIFKLITMTQICLFVFILISVMLIGVVIGDYFKISQLRMKYENILRQ